MSAQYEPPVLEEGFGRIEMAVDGSRPPRLFADPDLRRMYGIPQDATPEQAFLTWQRGIDPAYHDMLETAQREMLANPSVEYSFVWHHPEDGPFLVRAVGTGQIEGGSVVLYGTHWSMRGTKIVEYDSDQALIVDAQNSMYFCSAYVDISAHKCHSFRLSSGGRTPQREGTDIDVVFRDYVFRMAHPDHQQELLDFLDLETLQDRIGAGGYVDCDFLSVTDVGWCRARWLPVKWDGSGRLTHALFTIATINAAKQAEIERDHAAAELMRIHYDAAEHAGHTRTMGITLLDKATMGCRSWAVGDNGLVPYPVSYEDLLDMAESYAEPGARARVREDLSLANIVAEVEAHGEYVFPVVYTSPAGDRRYLELRCHPYSHDPNGILIVTEDVTAIHEQEGRSIEDFFDNVPGGLVTYEWDGQALRILHISKYYEELYGTSIAHGDHGEKSPDFQRIHPDDVAPYKDAIAHALSETHELHHVYRVWNPETERWSWTKTDAVSHVMPNGHQLVYAMYSDVSEQVEAQGNLEKTRASIRAALSTASQLTYEYDPVEHTGVCFTETNFFGLPMRIENYPESLRDYGIFHPDDMDLFIDATRKIDAGARRAQCDVRIRRNGGDYRWYSCLFTASHDDTLGRDLAILLVVDVTLRVQASRAVADRVDSLFAGANDMLAVCGFNLTRDEVTSVRTQDEAFLAFEEAGSYSAALDTLARGMGSPKTVLALRGVFGREELLARSARGESNIRVEGLFKLGPHRTEWLEVAHELVPNKATGEVEGIGYVRSLSTLRITSCLLRESLRRDYPAAALLVDGGDEYYLYSASDSAFCEHRLGFWDDYESMLASVCSPDQARQVCSGISREAVLAALADGGSPEFGFDVQSGEKRARFVLRFSMVDKDQGLVLAALRSVVDEAMFEQMRFDSRHDRLTGLYNRETLFSACRQMLDACPDEEFSLVRLDVRRFRLFNSFFGEAAGDDLLRWMASGMRNLGRQYGHAVFGRVESDVFAALVPTNPLLLRRGASMIARAFNAYSDDFLLEPCLGVYEVSDRALPIEAMLARATTAAKEARRDANSFVGVYDEGMDRQVATEVFVTREMQHALEDGQFKVYLQPKAHFATGRPAGAEALVRWVHPDRGVISPGVFIPVFESNGFVAKLDRHMWEQVCILLRRWADEGREPLPVSVNVSRVSAYNPQSAPFLRDLVERYRIDPGLLELELTESAYAEDLEVIKEHLDDLRAMGFKVLMDDFGTGYSSLNSLRDLPVDMIKLDRAFLTDACTDPRGRTVLSATVGMAHELGLKIVAEGVENEDQASYLRSIGCEYLQGFLYAKPMPVGEYEDFIGR